MQPNAATAAPELLTQKDICDRFGICDETWRRWRKRGRVPAPVNLPGRPRWRATDIDAIRDSLPIPTPGRRQFFPSRRRLALVGNREESG